MLDVSFPIHWIFLSVWFLSLFTNRQKEAFPIEIGEQYEYNKGLVRAMHMVNINAIEIQWLEH